MTDLVPGAAADGPVKGGAGSNPAGAGLEADRSVVPPPAAAHPSWRWPLVLAVACCAAACARWWPHVRDEFFVLLGSRNESGGWYGFHSGAGGALWMSAVPATALLYFHHNCHSKGCPWWGKHKVDGSPWCGTHHLDARRRVAGTGSAHDLAAGEP